MCFSATASFAASAALTVSGVLGMHFAVRGNKRFIALNMMPFFYAMQQFFEGMIWLNSPWLDAKIWGGLFLFFAFFVYPWYVGVGCYVITRQKHLRKRIRWIIFLGLIYGAWSFSNVLFVPHFNVDPCCAHIFYDVNLMGGHHIDGPLMHFLLIPLYVFFTSAPFFVSDRRYASVLGYLIILSSVVCLFIYLDYFISVWCFYAALSSLGIGVFTYWQWRLRRKKLR